jgi:hypothetical protein
MLADVLRACGAALFVVRPVVGLASADYRPTRLGRQVEAQQRMILFGDLQRGAAVAILLGQALDLVVEYVGQAPVAGSP